MKKTLHRKTEEIMLKYHKNVYIYKYIAIANAYERRGDSESAKKVNESHINFSS